MIPTLPQEQSPRRAAKEKLKAYRSSSQVLPEKCDRVTLSPNSVLETTVREEDQPQETCYTPLCRYRVTWFGAWKTNTTDQDAPLSTNVTENLCHGGLKSIRHNILIVFFYMSRWHLGRVCRNTQTFATSLNKNTCIL